jgi:putative transposase
MPRARRHFLPGYAWHITHRCHKKEFLLKFARDRRDWMSWLLEARRRYGLCVLNHVATSNHIHLLVLDCGREAISKSMQLVSGRTAQAFNQRKKRKGAFWEDRYHATAVEMDRHLISCLTYIDLNMVRAGVVAHPSEWETGGYAEMHAEQGSTSITDYRALMEFLDIESIGTLRELRKKWVEDALARCEMGREGKWTESIAVGSGDFVETIRTKLGLRAKGRRVSRMESDYILCETQEHLGFNLDT